MDNSGIQMGLKSIYGIIFENQERQLDKTIPERYIPVIICYEIICRKGRGHLVAMDCTYYVEGVQNRTNKSQ